MLKLTMFFISMCCCITTYAQAVTEVKKKTLRDYIEEANGKMSTTYGWGEWMCGDYGRPAPCSKGAITASGDVFHPEEEATAALFIPRRFGIYNKAETARLTLSPDRKTGCVTIRINDKGNERYYGRLGFDLSKFALKSLLMASDQSEKFGPTWMGDVYVCEGEE